MFCFCDSVPYWVLHAWCHGLWQVHGNLQTFALQQQNVQATLHLPGHFPLSLGIYSGHHAGNIALSLVLLWTQHHQPFLLCWPTPPNVDMFWHLHKANCPVCVCRDLPHRFPPHHPHLLCFHFQHHYKHPFPWRAVQSLLYLTAVTMVYGSLFCMYLRPTNEQPVEQGKIVSVFCIFVSAMLNPFIYSLRNKDVEQALRSTCTRKLRTMEKSSILTVSQWKISL